MATATVWFGTTVVIGRWSISGASKKYAYRKRRPITGVKKCVVDSMLIVLGSCGPSVPPATLVVAELQPFLFLSVLLTKW